MEDGSILPALTVSIGVAQMRPFDRVESLLEGPTQALALARHRGPGAVAGDAGLDG
jgi:PleD family two-component response regulator